MILYWKIMEMRRICEQFLKFPKPNKLFRTQFIFSFASLLRSRILASRKQPAGRKTERARAEVHRTKLEEFGGKGLEAKAAFYEYVSWAPNEEE